MQTSSSLHQLAHTHLASCTSEQKYHVPRHSGRVGSRQVWQTRTVLTVLPVALQHLIVGWPSTCVLKVAFKCAADPLVHHGNTRARNASEYIKVTEWVVANMGKMKFPVISFCSEKDTMCDPDGSKMLIDRSKVSYWTLTMLPVGACIKIQCVCSVYRAQTRH